LLARTSISADHVTFAGLGFAAAAAVAIAIGANGTALIFIIVSRLADGLDGAVARATKQTDRGGFLDITCDFVFYAAIPTAFAIQAPSANALPAVLLLSGFLVNGAAFLAFAIMAERNGIETATQGEKSLYYLMGLAEGAETIAFFIAFCLLPGLFPVLAVVFALMCLVSGAARIVYAYTALH
jgi:phosphatidylglycerophosphate synthase